MPELHASVIGDVSSARNDGHQLDLHIPNTLELSIPSWARRPVDEGDSDTSLLAVTEVLLSKEFHQQLLLHWDAVVEKVPRGGCVGEHGDRVAEEYLRTDRPPEEAKIRRVTQVCVNPVRYQRMLCALVFLNPVREVGGCCRHAKAACPQAHKADEQPKDIECPPRLAAWPPRAAAEVAHCHPF